MWNWQTPSAVDSLSTILNLRCLFLCLSITHTHTLSLSLSLSIYIYIYIYKCTFQPLHMSRMWLRVNFWSLSFPSGVVTIPNLKSLDCPTIYQYLKVELLNVHRLQGYERYVKFKLPNPAFELESLFLFPTTITIALQACIYIYIYIYDRDFRFK